MGLGSLAFLVRQLGLHPNKNGVAELAPSGLDWDGLIKHHGCTTGDAAMELVSGDPLGESVMVSDGCVQFLGHVGHKGHPMACCEFGCVEDFACGIVPCLVSFPRQVTDDVKCKHGVQHKLSMIKFVCCNN